MLAVGADTQRLVNHLLGQSRVRKDGWLRCALCLSWLLKRRKIKKGHLLALLGGEPWDVRLDKVFFFVDEPGCPSGYQIPRKHRFLCAGTVSAFPHEQAVLLGLISQALPVCDDLGKPVLVGGFQIFRPFLLIRVDGKEKLDLLLFVLEVVILVGDDGHDLLFIQKRRQFITARAFFRFIL